MKQHHSIWTPELVELSLPFAGVTRRILARIIDQVLLLGVYALIVLFGVMNVFQNSTVSVLVCMVLFVLADFFYFWGFHAWMNGQTPGKLFLGIRVVTARGGRINAVSSLIRALFNFLDGLLFYGGVAALMITATEQEKRIADYAAGTVVILDR